MALPVREVGLTGGECCDYFRQVPQEKTRRLRV